MSDDQAQASPVEALIARLGEEDTTARACAVMTSGDQAAFERGRAAGAVLAIGLIREQLAPAWAELTAERDAARGTRDAFAGRLGYVQDALAAAGYGPGPSDGAIRDLARERDGLRQEMQDAHDAVQAAYPGREIAEDTVAVLRGLVAERDAEKRRRLALAGERDAARSELRRALEMLGQDKPRRVAGDVLARMAANGLEPPDGSGQAALTAEELAPRLWDAYAATFLGALPAGRAGALRARWDELTGTERASWLAAARVALASGQQDAVLAELTAMAVDTADRDEYQLVISEIAAEYPDLLTAEQPGGSGLEAGHG